MYFVSVTYPDTVLLEQFLAQAGASKNTFRYYESRGFDVLQNHVCTELLLDEEKKPVAYGHLDKEGEIIWLGTAVIAARVGQGLGKKMMQHLMEQAKKNQIKTIRLSVDNANEAAIKLYTRFGFKTLEKREKIRFLEVLLP